MTYSLIFQENIKNIGKGYIYNHNKTDAKLVYIKNSDKNKVFSIAFKTLPKNSTGVQHIVEHCVLAGSKKYPLKEPFNQLDKCTLNTYLNAITFADKTLYPIGSTNDKDFFKLLDVYLDGVFFPLIYEKKGIFLQEGWNFNGKELNGVVYNEMKGAYSSPDSLIDYIVKKNIFNSGYGCDSGGYPEEITNLTYEDFLNYHKEYYNPTNCIIYLYGDLDINYYLDYIDKEYFSKFEKGIEHKIEKSKNIISNKIIEEEYYLEDDLEEKNYLQATFKLNFSLCQEKNIAFEIISNILTENQEGILKKALIEAGICTDVTSYIDDDMIEPIFTIQIEGTNEENILKFKEIFEKTITEIEINEELLLANLAPIEFYLKEGDFGYKPKGLFYNIVLLKDMLYNKFDFSSLSFDKILENVKRIDFKNLIKENFIENENYTYCILKATNKKIKKPKKEFEIDIKDLKIYQNEKDTKENLAKIPPLSIEEIDNNIFEINFSSKTLKNHLEELYIGENFEKFSNIPIIYNNINSEVFYINFVFDIKNLGNNPYITLFSYLLDKLGTNDISPENLELKLNYLFGDYKIFNGCYDLKNGEYMPALVFSARILEKNLENSLKILNNVFKNIDFSNKEKIKYTLKELISKLQLSYLKDLKEVVCKRARGYINEKYEYLEKIKGLEFYNWLKSLNLEKDLEDIIKNLENIKKSLYCKNRLYLGFAGKEDNFKRYLKQIKDFEFFEEIDPEKFEIDFKIEKNEAFSNFVDVNYNTLVSNLKDFGFEYNGDINLIKTILDTDYLWEKIRTEGGAYGAIFSIEKDGALCLNSYSDPNIEKTYENFYKISDYIKNINIDEDILHMYKIGSINSFDRIIKNHEINEISISRYFSGRTNEDVLKERNDILYAKLQDIKKYGDIFEKGLKNSYICTGGNLNDIKKCKNIFNKIKKID